jgi:hypothetical protein
MLGERRNSGVASAGSSGLLCRWEEACCREQGGRASPSGYPETPLPFLNILVDIALRVQST